MTLPKNVLLLWSGRIVFLNAVLIPLLNLSPAPFLYFIFLGLANIFVIAFLFIKYKSFILILKETSVTIKSGILLRKTLEIKFTSVCAVRTFATPLAKHLSLQNPVLYCEGVTFFLPALDAKTTYNLQKQLSAKEN